MRMSGTKPMKNTMRKQSPMKQSFTAPTISTVGAAVKTATDAVTKKKIAAKKPVDTKGSVGSPRTTVKVTKKTPAMQMKKSGMGKKC